MKLYVVLEGYDYEGTCLLDVYKSKIAAIGRVKREVKKNDDIFTYEGDDIWRRVKFDTKYYQIVERDLK